MTAEALCHNEVNLLNKFVMLHQMYSCLEHEIVAEIIITEAKLLVNNLPHMKNLKIS